MRRSGLVLLVVVGVLGVLTVLGVAFVTMARLERKASQQRLCATQALLLARSGLEDVLARLAAGQDPQTSDNRYGGENWDGSADGLLSFYEASQEVYHRTGSGSAADADACPVEDAMRPSFFVRGPAGPAVLSEDGRDRGVSGRLAPQEGTYSLKVSSQGGFYLNGGDPAAASTMGYNAVLRRMLGTLAEAVDREDGVAGDGPLAQVDGLNLVDRRPPSGWQDWRQVRDVALGGSQAKLDVFKPYLALYAWVDRKVVAPNALTAASGKAYHSWGEIKLDHVETVPGSRVPDFERIGGRIVGRAPVDLAWARTRRPVLIALLAGLKGLYLDESTSSPLEPREGGPGDFIGTLQPAEIANAWIPTDDCHRVADRLLSSTSDLGTWDRWNAFCDGVPFTDASDLAQAKRDLLKANFNPNSDLNKFGPNASFWRSVDKSDLLVRSTEFCLLPSAGAQEVESVGNVLGRDGLLLARRVLKTALEPASRLTLTTQGEFVCGDLGDPNVAGDECSPRLPGEAKYISRSAGLAQARTWGHALPGVGGSGMSLQTYPEPCADPGTGLKVRPAGYDGNLQLATVETPSDEWYQVPAPPAIPVRAMKLLARYTAGFDLDIHGGIAQNQPDLLQVTTPELGLGILDAAKPNTLYPDGCYSEKGRAPSYFDRDNADGFHGVASFWIKSNHRPAGSMNSRGHPFLKWTNFTNGIPNGTGPDQFFFLGEGAPDDEAEILPRVCEQFEIGHQSGSLIADYQKEHRFQRDQGLTPHVWQLLTICWDFWSARKDETGGLRVDAGLLGDCGATDVYFGNFAVNPDPVAASDITVDDCYGAHRLSLGGGRPLQESDVSGNCGSGADATVDELVLYDFGGTVPPAPSADPAVLACPGTVAMTRFGEGRYYKESDYAGLGAAANRAGEYFSAPLYPGGACRIKSLAWTQVVPQGLPSGGILLELADASGGSYLPDAVGNPLSRAWRDPAFSRVERRVRTPFRLHAVFQPNLDPATLQDTPILDPLALDDVTVVYELPEGRRILAWGGGD